ncbi:acetyl/propionyl/methylcrotonyl-CoA carboxylase subunit alpha [Sporosarcina sp. JAI121]|uniref:acetyl-CoA carboxylase biotin carboxylase subunit n=1 Tax=Sporosarcina sp. JAI121 TaxID=2723064 RepID=UPI0015C8F49C|nr:biotin carboxylase N-terminal domain-containing protein [Sporosarcina sp. JAI121]NYF24128.1 acetyl-CoA carboxylase biotin carboxylase subunit [Sporosarcina sp. JAI121]
MDKILIANRGEIALRIIKTCKRLGIGTIAVYSEADVDMPFVKEADEAFLLGPAQVQQSYLKADDIVEIAIRAGATAIHPGYGLLSENAEFVRKVQAAGIRFIGPDADTIDKMGDKIGSRLTMKAAGVPVVPGTDEGIATLDDAVLAAVEIGYPIMLKASAGGGGIGMVRCEDEQALSQHFQSVKTRAKAYFGDDVVFLEKFIADARHIEVQVFGDDFGNVVHMFERNCSVQRRNQKVIEESPSPHLPEEARQRLYKAAVDAAKAVSYKNAGTVEFIVDENNNLYFLEMNTRLQVEHPVTEEVTGFDLVEWQIEVVKGNKLPVVNQADIKSEGHAIEFRIYAEDPVKFMPSPGTIKTLDWGDTTGIRVDSGYVEGGKVTPFYDPLISKVIIHAATRGEAIRKSETFLSKVEIDGLKTNIPLFNKFLKSEEFRTGDYSTSVLSTWAEQQKEEITT